MNVNSHVNVNVNTQTVFHREFTISAGRRIGCRHGHMDARHVHVTAREGRDAEAAALTAAMEQ